MGNANRDRIVIVAASLGLIASASVLLNAVPAPRRPSDRGAHERAAGVEAARQRAIMMQDQAAAGGRRADQAPTPIALHALVLAADRSPANAGDFDAVLDAALTPEGAPRALDATGWNALVEAADALAATGTGVGLHRPVLSLVDDRDAAFQSGRVEAVKYRPGDGSPARPMSMREVGLLWTAEATPAPGGGFTVESQIELSEPVGDAEVGSAELSTDVVVHLSPGQARVIAGQLIRFGDVERLELMAVRLAIQGD